MPRGVGAAPGKKSHVLPIQPQPHNQEKEKFDELIGVVDTWQLRQLRWPILRLFTSRFVERRELDHYVQSLLANRAPDQTHRMSTPPSAVPPTATKRRHEADGPLLGWIDARGRP